MAKFIFRLENLLIIKGKLEEQKRAQFGSAKMKFNEEQSRLFCLQKQKIEYENRLRNCFIDKIYLLDVHKNQDALKITQINIVSQNQAVKEAEHQVELAQQALKEAMKEKKTYEKLKEKAFERFKMEVLKEESKESDELTSFKYGKAKGEMISYGEEKEG